MTDEIGETDIVRVSLILFRPLLVYLRSGAALLGALGVVTAVAAIVLFGFDRLAIVQWVSEARPLIYSAILVVLIYELACWIYFLLLLLTRLKSKRMSILQYSRLPAEERMHMFET
jgi:hypothetical protein